MNFKDLTKDQLWSLRNEIVLNSLFTSDYENTFGFNPMDVYSFFDGYYDYLWEISNCCTQDDILCYDSKDNLYDWFMSYNGDLDWIRNVDSVYDSKDFEIRKGDKVIWTDPETGSQTKYEVYEEPTEEMVKLWNEFGECEALPKECEVIR